MGEAIADIALGEDRFNQAIDKAKQEGKENLDLIDDFIRREPALSWVRPKAGLIGFCKLDLRIDADKFCECLLAPPYKTFVMSGSAYEFPQHIRVGAGGGRTNDLSTGLDRLAQFLETQN
jgi:aspartate/methionine/tyrosine aminotransferase